MSGYRIICISLYDENIADIAEAVAYLKAQGIKRVSRSGLIRVALRHLDLDELTKEDFDD